MDLAAARAFAMTHHRAVMATTRADGTPQMSPVLVAVDDDGRFVVSSRETAMKTRNLQKRRHTWLCILSDEFFGQWVQVEGEVEIVALPEALPLLVAYYRQISGEHPNWDDYRSAMEREQRVALVVTATRAGPNREG